MMRATRLSCLTALAAASLGLLLVGCAWGVVTDAQTGQPIVGAQVTFQDSTGGTGTVVTGAGGLYAFDAVNGQPIPAKGPVTYTVTAPDYHSLTVQRDVQYDDFDQGVWEIQSFALDYAGDRPSPPSLEGFQLVLDVDPVTAGVQTSGAVSLSSSPFRVDIILANPPVPLAAFQLSLRYDDTIIRAPEVDQAAPSLDDNPDANQVALGGGWDCSMSGAAFPQGDSNPATGPQGGEASIACINVLGPYTFTSTGVIASVTFVPAARGTTSLSLSSVALTSSQGEAYGRCNPATPSTEIPCGTGSIAVQ